MKHKPRLPLSAVAPLVLAALLAVALLLAALLPFDEARAASAPQDLVATADAPRAFGYFVGDIVTRRIAVQMPAPLQLDPDSLPHAGRQGQALELRSVDWQGRLYDCDCNQMLALPMRLADVMRPHLRDLLVHDPLGAPIRVADHCYGCTAGQGSSCGGALKAA